MSRIGGKMLVECRILVEVLQHYNCRLGWTMFKVGGPIHLAETDLDLTMLMKDAKLVGCSCPVGPCLLNGKSQRVPFGKNPELM
mmetsp:Transcript_28188/g.43979  ORF Transcript_28188/g.43979 Transcript_28188/m.43979 type:complete len:84 (+) Transcript_28188:919-1170(+)